MAEMVICQAEPLRGFVEAIVRQMGADERVSAEVASHLVRSNLSGHDSHGVIRIPQYMRQADQGVVVPNARPTILSESPVTALIDARRGFGHYSTAYALDWCMQHARERGLAAAAVRHSSHIGRVGEYTERAAGQGLIAMVTVGASGPGVGGMMLYGGTQRFFGANPWSFGVPARDHDPVVYDGSTSTIAEGKVRFARAKKAKLPPGCIVDRNWKPTTDPEEFYAGGGLVPLGGEVAGHKGYGLAMASALISGLCMIDDPDHSLIGASSILDVGDTRGQIAGVFVLVIDPGAFGDAEHYAALVSENLNAAKRVPPAPGVREILLPGEPEIRSRAERSRSGIAIPEATWADLEAVAKRFGVAMPAWQSRVTDSD